MKMTRRGFLGALVAGLAVAAVPALMPTDALAALVVNPNQKYIDALGMYDEAVALGREFKLTKDATTGVQMHEAVDRLFTHIFATFDAPERTKENHRAVSDMLKHYDATVAAQFRKVPPVVSDVVWPVMAMKSLLCDYALPVDHRKLTIFTEFHARYGTFIIDDV